MEIKGKKVLVAGCGISGIAAAALLEKKEACPILYDENKNADVNKIRERFDYNTKIRIILGKLEEFDFDLVVLSPGIPIDSVFVTELRSRGIPIIGEVELAYLCGKGRLLAITGTNGKTTTTALLGEIMKEYFESVFVVGNIGFPYTTAAEKMEENSITVAEISSFQLETVEKFHPKVSALLNITPDHLDRHHTMENYVEAKMRIFENQTEDDYCIINFEDPYRSLMEKNIRASVVYFSSINKLESGYYLEGDDIFKADNKKTEFIMNINEMKLLGIHNVENVMAAIAMAESFGLPREHILKVVRNFNAVEHRIEYVDTINGVDYYNDSKGTNPDAAIKAVQAMRRPCILIGGGYDKNSNYDDWINSFEDKVKMLVLIGQTKEKIGECAKAHGFCNYVYAESLEEAVGICYKNAENGEAVLLSPACASWGMFPNYEVRGRRFKELVKGLKEK